MSSRLCVLTAVVMAMCPGLGLAGELIDIVINEFMASNSTTLRDAQRQYDDWVELYNRSDTPVDVGGAYLTDDLSRPTRWRIPDNDTRLTTIAPHGYLLIWADGDVADAGLHADFGLSASGEEIALYHTDGFTLIDSVSYNAQVTDVSFGRMPDGEADWQFMARPTPEAANADAYLGFVDDVQVSHDHGFYDQPFTVTLTVPTEGADIRYTLDATLPYKTGRSGHLGTQYTGPIPIDRTTCLRAVAVKPGWKESKIITVTYLFVEDVIQQSPGGQRPDDNWPGSNVNGQLMDYGMDPAVVNDPRYAELMDDALLAIPTMSLVTEHDNLFHPQTGIYVNARATGRSWERPVSVELIHADGTAGFQINAGVRVRGGYSRSGNNPKHAFRLFFRNGYGEPTLRYPLFGDEGVDEFENIDLRTSQNYSWSFEGGNRDTFVREVFSRDTQRDMDQPYTRSRYYHLYVNGHYWGLFQTQERSEASYAQTYWGGAKEDYDVIKSRGGNGGYDLEATDGSLEAWRRLWDAANAGFHTDENYYRVQGMNPDGTENPQYEKLLDVDNLIDYMLCTYYVGDPDGPVSAWARVANNFYGIYNRAAPNGFVFFRHDAEHSLWDLHESRLFVPTTTAVGNQFHQSNPLWMHLQLMLHPEYKLRFVDRVHAYFFNSGLLTPDRCIDRFMARANQVDLAIMAESARWGDAKRSTPRTRDDDWLPDINRMLDYYFPARTNVVLNQFKREDWYPETEAPVFYVDNAYQHGGQVASDALLTMENPNGAGDIYYTLDGSDPRFLEIVEGDLAVLLPESAPKRFLVPFGDAGDWQSPGFDDSTWTEGSGGIGFEIGWDYQDFIGADIFDEMWALNGSCLIRTVFDVNDPADYGRLMLRMRYDDGFAAYLNGVKVAEVFAPAELQWDSTATHAHEALAAFETFNISTYISELKSGENVLAIQGLNSSSTSPDFLISVELIAKQGPREEAGLYVVPVVLTESVQIKARVNLDGEWSALNEAVYTVGDVAGGLRITELMYHPEDPNEEFIELTNISEMPLNLNLARFTNGIDFGFGAIDLDPGAHVLVVRDVNAFEAAYGSNLPIAGQYAGNLDNAGERIELTDAHGAVIQRFRYRDDWYVSTDGDGFSLEVLDPQADPQDLSHKEAWLPSQAIGGSPGRVSGI